MINSEIDHVPDAMSAQSGSQSSVESIQTKTTLFIDEFTRLRCAHLLEIQIFSEFADYSAYKSCVYLGCMLFVGLLAYFDYFKRIYHNRFR